MDESLKARLIGAAVLVALAVLLIPELLSGRKTAEQQPADPATARGTRTFTIELNGGEASGNPPLPPVAEAPSSPDAEAVARRPASEVPAAEPETAIEPESAPPAPAVAVEQAPTAVAVAPRAPEAVPQAPPATPVAPPPDKAPAAVARGGWAVQVGAFGSAATAQRLVKDLQGAGYQAYVSPVNRSGKTLHRVRVGPEIERDDANRLAERLKGRGLPAAVVAND
jgi:DedD protein